MQARGFVLKWRLTAYKLIKRIRWGELKIKGREGIIDGMKSLGSWKMMGSSDKKSKRDTSSSQNVQVLSRDEAQ